jgi:hypothetical protein
MFVFKDTFIPLLVFPVNSGRKNCTYPKGEALSQGDVNFGLIDNEPHDAERIHSATLKPPALMHSQSRTSYALDKRLKTTKPPDLIVLE